MRLARIAALSWMCADLAIAAVACRGDGADAAGHVDAGSAPGIDAGGAIDTDAEPGPDAAPVYNVVEAVDLGASWECTITQTCYGDYLDFLDLAAEHARATAEDDVNAQLDACAGGGVEPLTDAMAADALRDALLDALNTRFLVEGIDDRLLVATTILEQERDDYLERVILFEDPYVGTVEGIYLRPRGDGPFPGIVAVHGHGDDAGVYKDDYHGAEYPARGYAILMLTMRAMGADGFEHTIARELLLDGFSLIGLRSYETLLGLKYLRYLPEVDSARIGLIGHSGGSAAGNLTIRVEPDGFAAYVSDMTHDYCDPGSFLEPYHCETLPALYPLHALVADFSTAAMPVLQVPYGYTDGMAEIFDFFAARLDP